MKQDSAIIQLVNQPSLDRRIHKSRHLLLTLMMIIFMLNCEASAADNGAFYLSKWGSQNTFEGPAGVAIDSGGNIYVVDRGNHRIQKFSPDRELYLQWGSYGSGDGQFNNPRGIAVDSWGNVYVADEGNHRIQKFDSSGAFLQKWGSYGTGNGQFNRPFGVTVRGYSVYVADTQNHRIQKFTSTIYGAYFVDAWGAYGTGNAQFKQPRGLALDSAGNVYVADTDNHRIQKFDKNTNAYLDQWGIFGTGNGQFNHPRGVAVDGNGAVYVADTDSHRIQKFTSTGLYIGKWGSIGTGNGQFNFPTSVAVGKGCAIVVSDTSNHRVQKFACDNTNYLAKWGGPGTGNGEFNHPSGVAVDSAGNVYVADNENHRIQKFSSSGAYLMQWGHLGIGNGEFNHPKALAVDSAGYVYVADVINGRIQKFTSSGIYVTQWPSPGGLPWDIAVDGVDNVYIITTVNQDGVYQCTPDGGFCVALPATDYLHGQGIPHHPLSIAVDDVQGGAFAYYVATFTYDVPSEGRHGDKILRFDYPSVYQWAAAADDIAVDGAGLIYAIGGQANLIQKFTSTGVNLKQWGSSGTGNAQFSGPQGIAIDKNCNVYVADTENHRIQKFSTVPSVLLIPPPLPN